MIALIQRVSNAKVTSANEVVGEIQQGILVLLGVEQNDSEQQAEQLLDKLLKLRIFSDEQGKMNLNVQQIQGSLLVVSQFTLTADVQKGNRPGFSRGASPLVAEQLYNYFCQQSAKQIHTEVGKFGADMQVSLVNDGPVTFWVQM